jgi:hypothetical protein
MSSPLSPIPSYGDPVAPVAPTPAPAPTLAPEPTPPSAEPPASIPSYGTVPVSSQTPPQQVCDDTVTPEPSYGGDPLIQGSWHQLPQIEHPIVVAGSIAPVSEPEPEPAEYDPTEKVVAGSVSKTYLTGSEHGIDWTWEQIRDFVVAGIEQNVGYFPRNPLTESGIFKSFKSRWGDLAGPIAIYSIDVAGGWWQNAPISVNRFCKGSDAYFSAIIAERLESALAQSA